MMGKIGYIRVSTAEQHEDRQVHSLKEAGAEKVYIDKLSGKTLNRPELRKMLEYVRSGDLLIVESVSRLARSTRDLLSIVDALRAKEVGLISQKENIDTSTPQGRFVLSIFSALSELERETLLQRQREGIEAAKRRGTHMGRPPAKLPANWDSITAKWKAGEIKTVDAIKASGLSKASFYRKVRGEK
jgi:DNA invertase Pin-like site-specific DNA recombinase